MTAADPTNSILLFAAAFLASAIGVALFRRWSRSRGFLDVPNERSSHIDPTPRGGGLIIAFVCLASYVAIGFGFGLPFSWGYFLGALMVATVSWLDDLYSLPFWSRLAVHTGAAGILTYDLGFWSDLLVPYLSLNIPVGGAFGAFLTVAWIVWLLNAYNFMDGIDGIAALQAVVSGVAWTILSCSMNLNAAFLMSGVIAAASAGFLIHNWQPARIFLGDVGSAFLGFTLAAMPLLARTETLDASALPAIGVLFVWFFVLDTVFTLVRRLVAGKRVWEAHREHIYQKLVIEGRRHAAVAAIYGCASALLALFVLLATILSGIYAALALLSFVVLTSLLIYLGVRKSVDVTT